MPATSRNNNTSKAAPQSFNQERRSLSLSYWLGIVLTVALILLLFGIRWSQLTTQVERIETIVKSNAEKIEENGRMLREHQAVFDELLRGTRGKNP